MKLAKQLIFKLDNFLGKLLHPANTIYVAAQLRNGRCCVFKELLQVTVAGGRSVLVGWESSLHCRCWCCPHPSRSPQPAPPLQLFRSGCSPPSLVPRPSMFPLGLNMTSMSGNVTPQSLLSQLR